MSWRSINPSPFAGHVQAYRIMCVADGVCLIRTVSVPSEDYSAPVADALSGSDSGENSPVPTPGDTVDFDLPSGRFVFRLQVITDTVSPWSSCSHPCRRPTQEQHDKAHAEVDARSVIESLDDVRRLAVSLESARDCGLYRPHLENGFEALFTGVNDLMRATLAEDGFKAEEEIMKVVSSIVETFQDDDMQYIIAPELLKDISTKRKRTQAIKDLRAALKAKHYKWLQDCVAEVQQYFDFENAPDSETQTSYEEVQALVQRAENEALPRIAALEALEDDPTEHTLQKIKEHLRSEDMPRFKAQELRLRVRERVVAMARTGDFRRLEDALHLARAVDPTVTSEVYFRQFGKYYLSRTQYNSGTGTGANVEDAAWAIRLAKGLGVPHSEMADAEKSLKLLKEQAALKSALQAKFDFSGRLEMAVADLPRELESLPDMRELNTTDMRDIDTQVLTARQKMVDALNELRSPDLMEVLLAFSSCLKLKCYGDFQRRVCGLVALRFLEDQVAERAPEARIDYAMDLCVDCQVETAKVEAIRNHLRGLGYAKYPPVKSRVILQNIIHTSEPLIRKDSISTHSSDLRCSASHSGESDKEKDQPKQEAIPNPVSKEHTLVCSSVKVKVTKALPESEVKRRPSLGARNRELREESSTYSEEIVKDVGSLEADLQDALVHQDSVRTERLLARAPRFLSAVLRAKAYAFLKATTLERRIKQAAETASPDRIVRLKKKLALLLSK